MRLPRAVRKLLPFAELERSRPLASTPLPLQLRQIEQRAARRRSARHQGTLKRWLSSLLPAVVALAAVVPTFAGDFVPDPNRSTPQLQLDIAPAEVTVDQVYRYGAECVVIATLQCFPGEVCRPASTTRCTTGGTGLNVRIGVAAHPGTLRVEAWEVQPCAAGGCTRALRAVADWSVGAGLVGAQASKEFRLEVPLLDDPHSSVEIVVGSIGRVVL